MSTLSLATLTVLASGCSSRRATQAQIRAAYLAGQQQGIEMGRSQATLGPSVRMLGSVRNPVLPWTPGLTLAKAVVAAQYIGVSDPQEITLVREGKATQYDPKRLLQGEDVLLQPNDMVQIQ